MSTPSLTPLVASTQANSTQNASPSPPSANDILQQAAVIERFYLKDPEGVIPATVIRPFFAALRELLAQDTPIKRIKAKLDKLSAAITCQPS